MKRLIPPAVVLISVLFLAVAANADRPRIEVSDDGHWRIEMKPAATDGSLLFRSDAVPFGATPDWQNALRVQVGGLQARDMNGDGLVDVVVGCYSSNSYPPYDDWENLIYYNTGGQLEATPSWVSTDEVSTGDIQVGDINGDTYLDVFAANGGYSMDSSRIYWGSPTGPSTTPGWLSNEPGRAWNNYAILFDFDHDHDLDVVTANQGNSPSDPYRPMFAFINAGGTLSTTPGWQSAETSIQNFLAFADHDDDGWEDLAVSKWSNFESGVYRNAGGALQNVPLWTTGDDDTDKGVAWADIDGDTWPEFILGHDPTQMFANDDGTLMSTPSWQATGGYFGHSELRCFDLDRDCDPDLAEIHFSNGYVNIYLNENGTLAASASWTFDCSGAGTAVAFGDINGDEWPDLIVGNSGDSSVMVFYAQPPDYAGDLDDDGDVDLADLQILLGHYGTPSGAGPNDGDLDGDGDVDLLDLQLLLVSYGLPCG